MTLPGPEKRQDYSFRVPLWLVAVSVFSYPFALVALSQLVGRWTNYFIHNSP